MQRNAVILFMGCIQAWHWFVMIETPSRSAQTENNITQTSHRIETFANVIPCHDLCKQNNLSICLMHPGGEVVVLLIPIQPA